MNIKLFKDLLQQGNLEVAPPKPIKITDLTPRDGQQCKLATRVRTDDLLPLCEKMDKAGFYAVEVWVELLLTYA